MNELHDAVTEAARLLVEIAGPETVHIEMSTHGPKKYYDVHRAFDLRDGRAHLLGWRTKGATLRHPGGMTRSLCYDADTSCDWQLLLDAAQVLAESGYTPLLEVSPVGRGGHLWIIFTSLVCAAQAMRHAMELAPRLREIVESWPGVRSRARKVRLPAGKYVQPDFRQWCTLSDARGTLLATDGQSAARILLDNQTPVHVVPNTPVQPGTVGEHDLHAPEPIQRETQAQFSKTQPNSGEVDVRWQKKYHRFLWFQFTPGQLAALYNERHPLQDMLHLEQNGMAFSPSVNERTPSTTITQDGQAWVDFSARSMQPDGKHDGGDALELAARRHGESKAAKSNTLREAAHMLVGEARVALEAAARAGEEPPSWVTKIMTEAGWKRYHSLRAESTADRATLRGVTGFQNARMTTQAAQEQATLTIELPPSTTQAGAYKRSKGQGSLEALATTIGAQISESCRRCGCTLFYQSGPHHMCHLCYPRPAKFGRLTDEQWQQLRSLFPRKPESPDTFKRRNNA